MAKVDTIHPLYTTRAVQWQRCRDASAGQDAVHAAGEAYLPRLTDQEDAEYKAYKLRATFYNATWRTLAGMLGMLFAKPPVATYADEEGLRSVTSDGLAMDLLAQVVALEHLTVGRVGILVDFPTIDVTRLTEADVRRLAIRPTISLYRTESICNWKYTVTDGRRVLSMVVLRETATEHTDDEFVEASVVKYRVLDLYESKYRVRMFKKRANEEVYDQEGPDVFPQMRGNYMSSIPFFCPGVAGDGVDPEIPPMIDLVDLNLAHYRVTADYEHGCHFTALPTGYITGYESQAADGGSGKNTKIKLGSTALLLIPRADAKVGFLEFAGAGLSSLSENLKSKEERMAVLGARMLESQKKAVEAADTARMNRAGEQSLLANIARNVSDGLTAALRVFAEWSGYAPDDVSYSISDEAIPANMDAQMLSALVMSWQSGAISKQTLFANMQRGGVVSEATDFETEEARISSEPIA